MEEVTMLTERVYKKRGREEEKTIPIQEYLTKNYKVVRDIQTPQCVLIPFCFPGKPLYCPYGEKDDLENEFKKMSLDQKKFEEHWDLFPAYFLFDNDKEVNAGRCSLLKPLKRREEGDILIQVSPKMTWVFRPSKLDDILKAKGYQVSHYLAGTHSLRSLASYSSPEARALHLILEEYQKNTKACIILDDTYWYTYSNKSNERKDKLPYLYLYEALFSYYSSA